MKKLLSKLCLAVAAVAAGLAAAQAPWPNQPVKIIVPWAAGGTVDMGARLVGQKLAEQTGQPFVVENKPGGSSTIGIAQLVKSPADGHTLIAYESSYAMLPALFANLSFDHANDLAPVGTLFIYAQVQKALADPGVKPE